LIDTGELKQSANGQWHYRPPTQPRDTPTLSAIKSVFSVFSRRVEKLSQPSRAALAIAALIEPGAEFDFDVWVKALGGEAQQEFARTVIDEGLREHLLRQVGEHRYIFHPTDLARMFTASLAEDELGLAHHQIADILSQQEASPALVGYHYEQAGLKDEAAQFLEMAAAEAETANAIKTAIDYYNRAINLRESLTAYKALGRLYREQGEWDHSLVALQQALEIAEELDDITAQAQVMNSLSFTLWLYDDYREAYDIAATVLKLDNISASERATAQSHLGMISWLIGELAEAEEWCQKSVQLLEQQNDEASLAGAYNRLGLVHYTQGKLAEACQIVQRSIDLRQKLGDHWGYAFSLNNMGRIKTDQGDFEQASALLDKARELFEQVNSQDGLMSIYTSYGRLMLFQQRPQEALAWLIKAEQFAIRIGKHTSYGLSYIYLLQAQAKLDEGDIEVARTLTDEALELVQAAENWEYIARALLNQAQIEAAAGEQTIAAEKYERAMALYERVGSRTGWLRARLRYAHFLGQQGQSQAAADIEADTRAEAAKIGAYLP
jgi:tetratricopeptide (TPR) repeat protein